MTTKNKKLGGSPHPAVKAGLPHPKSGIFPDDKVTYWPKLPYVRKEHDVLNFIREWRTNAGLSIDALGKAAGLSGSMISQLERGKATYTQNSLEAVAKALGIQAWQLLAGGPAENDELWRHVLAVALPDTDLTAMKPDNRATLQKIVKHNCKAAIETARDLHLLEPV